MSAPTGHDASRPGRGPYIITREFHVRPGRETQFEQVYGPDGDSVRLFR